MPSKERITYLFQRFFDKSCTEEEKEELMDYINHSEYDAQLRSLIDITWEQELPDYHQPAEKASEIFQHIIRQQGEGAPVLPLRQYVPARTKWWRYAAAAVAVLVLGASLYWFTLRGNTGNASGKTLAGWYKAEIGEMKTVQLPDGTVVTLNANSSIKLNKDFNTSDRRLELSGEAFFKVAQNPSRPFIIHTDRMDVRVLGTSFNVKAYPDDQNFETTLIQGSVEVEMNNEEKRKVILKPNEKVTVENSRLIAASEPKAQDLQKLQPRKANIIEPVTLSRDSSIVEISWTNNQLAFNNNTFEEIAKKIERWYGVNMQFENEQLKQGRFTITIEKESLETVMQALQWSSPGTFSYQYNKENKSILIK
ncbi:MAG: FecR family protein [Chitinophagaceae bacterium]|nr:FecR family protein [Chitinophagaceae bacterium]